MVVKNGIRPQLSDIRPQRVHKGIFTCVIELIEDSHESDIKNRINKGRAIIAMLNSRPILWDIQFNRLKIGKWLDVQLKERNSILDWDLNPNL